MLVESVPSEDANNVVELLLVEDIDANVCTRETPFKTYLLHIALLTGKDWSMIQKLALL